MAVTAYVGMPRAGKSYEVVVNVILSSIQQGRNVISNIAGLNQDLMYEFLIAEGRDSAKFGKIINVTVDEIKQPNFWLTDRDLSQDQKNSKFIKAGDLVALDEIWKFFPPDAKLPEYVLNFFRMHGHFVNQDTGLTCEIALISQDVADFHRSIKTVISQTLEMEKNTAVGSDTSYMIKVYKKAILSRKPLKTLGPYFYNKKYFPLYKSNSINETGIKPREERTEKRNNVLKSKLIMFGMPLALIMITGGVYGVKNFFFNPDNYIKNSEVQNAQSDTDIKTNQPTGTPIGAPLQVQNNVTNDQARLWRVAGLYGDTLNQKAVLVNQYGQSRLVIPKTVSHYADFITITIYPHGDKYTNEPLSQSQGFFK